MVRKSGDSRVSVLKDIHRLVVKIGSGLISSRDRGLSTEQLERYVDQMAQLRKVGLEVLLVSSGAIVSGVEKLGWSKVPRTLPEKQAAAAVGQSRLMWAYERLFEERDLIIGQVLLTPEILIDRKRFLNSRNTITTLLNLGVVPIINENDTVAVDEIRFGDNDNLASLVTHLMDADLLIILSDVDGLYTADPNRNSDAILISLVKAVTKEIEDSAGMALGPEGVGGMATKIQAAKRVAAFGVPTVIASGREPDVIRRILQGEEIGTLVLPQTKRLTSRKYWIAYTLKSKGRLILDDGAVEALARKGKSLLPSGILKVEGKFESGDAVSCVNEEGKEVAKGMINYASREVEKIKGANSQDLVKILGYKDYDEVIHRDNLVLL